VKIGGEGTRVTPPTDIPAERVFLQTHGPIIGHSLATRIDRLIYVVPAIYGQLSVGERGAVARAIGKLTHLDPPGQARTTMLVGPGRWGTSMPSLGVPVSFAEINTVSVICELAMMHAGLVPDVSLGTHFFNDLVELDMLYLAVSPGRPDNVLHEALLRQYPNQLPTLLPSATTSLAKVLWVLDVPGLQLHVDSMKQAGICYCATST
jgi:hypothetical protein